MEIRIDIDQKLLHAASQQERQDFQTALFCAASRATTDYGARVNCSDPLHWVITAEDWYEDGVRELFDEAHGRAAGKSFFPRDGQVRIVGTGAGSMVIGTANRLEDAFDHDELDLEIDNYPALPPDQQRGEWWD